MSAAFAETATVDVTTNPYRESGWRWSSCVTVPNILAIGQTIAEISTLNFQKYLYPFGVI